MNTYQRTTFQFQNNLTAEQLNFFKTNGVLHFKNFIGPEKVKTFLTEIENIQSDLIEKKVTKINGVPLKWIPVKQKTYYSTSCFYISL